MIFQDIQSMDEEKSWHTTFQYLNVKSREKAGSQKTGKSATNRALNRYRDVVPYDHSLVLLRNSDTAYINANLVKVPSIDKKYILTQGPLANTCKHFWQMVWEQNTYSVVMLNRVVEKNQLKCHQYWPLSGSLVLENFKVTLLEEDDHNEFVVRILKLEHLQEKKSKTVRHFHYVAWPDFGVPVSPQAFLKYLFCVREYQSSVDGVGPPVIHCSAGIGRSGTFALIDAALTEIKQKNDMMDYDVKKVLQEMRSYRAGLIQTTEQLRFSYIAILEGANMVAPEAYGAAYWKMASREESGNEASGDEEYEEKDDEPELHGKRGANSENHEVTEEPKAKEPRKEIQPTELSESESGEEDEIVDLSDIDVQNGDDVGGGNEDMASAVEIGPEIYGNVAASGSGATEQGLDFRQEPPSPTPPSPTPPTVPLKQGRKEAPPAESDAYKGGTNDEKGDEVSTSDETTQDENTQVENTQVENTQVENNACLMPEREIKTTTCATPKDTLTNADVGNSRHEQLVVDEAERIASKKSNVKEIENEESAQAVNSADYPGVFDAFNSNDVVSGDSSVETVVGRWQSSEAGSSESLIRVGGGDTGGGADTGSGDTGGGGDTGSGDTGGGGDTGSGDTGGGGDTGSGDTGGGGEVGHQAQPKRSAMRTNSGEGKRKSVSFMKNGEEEQEDEDESTWPKYNPIDSLNEMDTESSMLRKRQTEERKQKLADKVDKMKKKLKDQEAGGSYFGKTMIAGLVICFVAAGVAFFCYRYQS